MLRSDTCEGIKTTANGIKDWGNTIQSWINQTTDGGEGSKHKKRRPRLLFGKMPETSKPEYVTFPLLFHATDQW